MHPAHANFVDPSIEKVPLFRSQLEAGQSLRVQFWNPSYTSAMLTELDGLCRDFGASIYIRFFGHLEKPIDLAVLQDLPNVQSLGLEFINAPMNIEAIEACQNLLHFSLGGHGLSEPDILRRLSAPNLETLILTETRISNFALSPVTTFGKLRHLFLNGQTREIDHIGLLQHLESLSLSSIPKRQSLAFVSSLRSLKRLSLNLGGRPNIDEIEVSNLESLEILRVRGFSELRNLERFPALRSLKIRDEPHLTRVRFSPENRALSWIEIINCKRLADLQGLADAHALQTLRLGPTALTLDSILSAGLPPQLKTFDFFSSGNRQFLEDRRRLNELGFDSANPR